MHTQINHGCRRLFKRSLIQTHAYAIQFFPFFSSRLILSIRYRLFSSNSDSIILCASVPTLTLLFSCRMISSTDLLTIALLYCCLVCSFLFSWLCPRLLVCLILAYLEPKSPRTLYLSDECPWPWMRLVGLYLPFRWSTYIFLRLSALLHVPE